MAIRIGLIGAGRVGCAHLESLATIPEVEVAAVCDSDRARAESAAQSFGAAVHINFRALLEAERLDAVILCLPPFARGEPEMLAARAGIHLLVEGPVAVSVQKARQVQEEIEKGGVLASVACPWRYLSGTDRAMEMLSDRKIALVRAWRFGPPPPTGWRCRRESSGGYFLQEAADLIDLARHLAGEITTVSAMEFQGIAAARLPDYDIEDALAAVVHFRSGAVGEIVSTDIAPSEESVLSVTADRLEMRITSESLEVVEPGQRTRQEHSGVALRASQEAFLEAVRSGNAGAIRCTYADAVRTLEVLLATTESAQTGKVIKL